MEVGSTPPVIVENKFTNAVFNEFFTEADDLNKAVILNLLNSDSDNPLRQTVISSFNNKLHNIISDKTYIDTIVISEQLTTLEKTRLELTYSDLNIKFLSRDNCSHAFASASRKCERKVLLSKLRTNPLVATGERIILKEVGGNIVNSLLTGEKGVHCCSPILSSYDSTRLGNRLFTATTVLSQKTIASSYQKTHLTEYIRKVPTLSPSRLFCFGKSQHCNVASNGLLFLHSNYDITLENFGNIMDSANALVAYGSFVFDPIILTDDHGTIEFINSHFFIERSKICNKRKKIFFGFTGCSGFNYEHDYATYISYVTNSQFRSSRGSRFSLELLENRNGVQFYRVTRLLKTVGPPTIHRVYLSHLKNKYVVRFPNLRYNSTSKDFSYPRKGLNLPDRIRIDSSFWRNLPKNTDWVTYAVDCDVVDKCCAYVLGVTEEKFKPEQIITYIRSLLSREVLYASISAKKDLPGLDPLCAISFSIYVSVFHAKYVYGKVLQQAISDIQSLRRGLGFKKNLKEFDYYKNRNIFKKFWDFVCRRQTGEFDPRQFIVKPAEFIQIRTTGSNSCIVSDHVYESYIVNSDIIVTSDLQSGTNSVLGDSSSLSVTLKNDEITTIPSKLDSVLDRYTNDVGDIVPGFLSKFIPNCFSDDLAVFHAGSVVTDSVLPGAVTAIPVEEAVVASEFEFSSSSSVSLAISQSTSTSSLPSSVPLSKNFCSSSNSSSTLSLFSCEEVLTVSNSSSNSSLVFDDCLDVLPPDSFSDVSISDIQPPSDFCDSILPGKELELSVVSEVSSSSVFGVKISIYNELVTPLSLFETDYKVLIHGVHNFYNPNRVYGYCGFAHFVSINTPGYKHRMHKFKELHRSPLTPTSLRYIVTNFKGFRRPDVYNLISDEDFCFDHLVLLLDAIVQKYSGKKSKGKKITSLDIILPPYGCGIWGRPVSALVDLLRFYKPNGISIFFHIYMDNYAMYHDFFTYLTDCTSISSNSTAVTSNSKDDAAVVLTPVAEREVEEEITTSSDFQHVLIGSINNSLTSSRYTPYFLAPSSSYPSLGVFDPRGYLSVDGSRNDCCFIAATENRSVDPTNIKKMILDLDDLQDPQVLESEVFDSAGGGSLVLRSLSRILNVEYSVLHGGTEYVINDSFSYSNFFRRIYLLLENNHYFIRRVCPFAGFPVSIRRDAMFYPFDMLRVRTSLSAIVEYKFLAYLTDLAFVDKVGTYFLNNLSVSCCFHERCRLNNLRYILDSLSALSSRGLFISLIIAFELNSFELTYFCESLSKFPSLFCRIIDISIEGYILVYFYFSLGTTNTNFLEQVGNSIVKFLNHKCEPKGNFLSLDTKYNILFTCSTVKHNSNEAIRYYNIPLDNPDYLIILTRSTDGLVTVSRKNSTLLSISATGDSSLCNSIPSVLTHIKEFLSSRSYLVFSLRFDSDFTNISSILQFLSSSCRFLYINVKDNAHVLDTLCLNYYPDDSIRNKFMNSMTEAYSSWHHESDCLVTSLSSGYNVLLDIVTKGMSLATKIDNTLALFDLSSATFTYGLDIQPPYSIGYSSCGILSTVALFSREGKTDIKECKRLLKQGLNYIAFSIKGKIATAINLTNSYSISDVPRLPSFEIEYIQGVPGAGKTTEILKNNVGRPYNLILTVTREARRDMLERALKMNSCLGEDRIKTIDSFLLNSHGSKKKVDEVWIDEALLVHCGTWMWVVFHSSCRKLVVVGDEAQIPYINRNGFSTAYHLPTSWDIPRRTLSVNHRNPLDIVQFLNSGNFYKFVVTGTSSFFHSVTFVKIFGIANVPLRDSVQYLTFTQAEKSILLSSGFNVKTIHEFQGSQSKEIALVRLNTKEADVIYKSRPHILVALTRHRQSFVYYSVTVDTTASIVNNIATYTKFSMKDYLHLPVLRGGHLTSDFSPFERKHIPEASCVLYKHDKFIVDTLIKNGFDGFLSATHYPNRDLPVEYEHPLINVSSELVKHSLLQNFYDRVLPGASVEFREFDHDFFEYTHQLFPESPITVGMYMPTFKKYSRLDSVLRTSLQYPVHQSQKIVRKAFLERNGQVPQLQGVINDVVEAERLFNDFKKLFVQPPPFSEEQIFCNVRSLTDWFEGQPPSVRKIIASQEEFFEQRFTSYDFIIKSVAKIDLELGAEFRYKSPQTIAYQTKTINSVFCPIMKEMTSRVETYLHPNILLYNGMSPQQFADYLNVVFPVQVYSRMKDFLEIDFSKYDKSQGLVLLIFEVMLMEYLGVPPLFLRYWIVMHRYTVLFDNINKFKARVSYQRKSGDAATWRLNTIVQLAILNSTFHFYEHLFRPFSNIFVVLSGDDSLIFYETPFTNLYSRVLNLQFLYNMEAKLMNYTTPYFCSKFLVHTGDTWIFVPDTMKLISKLGRCDLVDFDHVECYRVSFSDNLYYYKFPEYWPFISLCINDRYSVTGEHDCIFSELLSLSSNSSSFSTLFYEGLSFIKGVINVKPTLDIF